MVLGPRAAREPARNNRCGPLAHSGRRPMISEVIPAMSRGTTKLHRKATEFPACRQRYEPDTDRTQVSSVTAEGSLLGSRSRHYR
jgi:hypothetical protein